LLLQKEVSGRVGLANGGRGLMRLIQAFERSRAAVVVVGSELFAL
jgi:hypothetical protein